MEMIILHKEEDVAKYYELGYVLCGGRISSHGWRQYVMKKEDTKPEEKDEPVIDNKE